MGLLVADFRIFDGSFICRCLYILRPSSVPRHSICLPQLGEYTLIINYLYFRFYILHRKVEFLRGQVVQFLLFSYSFESAMSLSDVCT